MHARIKDIRTSLNMSQTEFAQSLHMTPASISMIESGKRPVTDRLVHNICSEFDVSETWLRTGEGDMFPPPSEEDDDLIELLGALASEDIDPRRKRLVATLCRYVMNMSDSELDGVVALYASLSEAAKDKTAEE